MTWFTLREDVKAALQKIEYPRRVVELGEKYPIPPDMILDTSVINPPLPAEAPAEVTDRKKILAFLQSMSPDWRYVKSERCFNGDHHLVGDYDFYIVLNISDGRVNPSFFLRDVKTKTFLTPGGSAKGLIGIMGETVEQYNCPCATNFETLKKIIVETIEIWTDFRLEFTGQTGV